MAIITKFQITRYKEIQYNTPTGTVQDGQFSTFSLDDPNVFDSGTIDFAGVMQNVVLLGDLLRIRLDTGNVSLQQFNTLTYNQVQENIANGIFTVNQENIGWVVLGEARKSFYYVDCSISGNTNDGKRPSVEYYYDFSDLGLNGEIVSGDENGATTGFLTGGPPNPALEVIGTFNSGETFFDWGTTPYPNQQDVSLTDYIRFATTGGTIQAPPGSPDTITLINSNRRFNIQLLQSSVEEHRDNVNATPDSSGKYGRPRNPIQEGFAAFVSSQGNCIFTGITGTGTGGPNVVIRPPGTTFKEEPDSGIDIQTNQTVFYVNPSFIEGCPSFEEMPINFPPHDNLTQDELQNTLLHFNNYDPGENFYVEGTNEQGMQLLRANFRSEERTLGIVDPREIGLDNNTYPAGLLHILFNKNNCSFDVFPAMRDKDGDIPEPIGPVLSYYMENVRRDMYRFYNIPFNNQLLKPIGTDTLGYERYSDGNSYKELLGESVLGCGDELSFDKIPEILVELYPKNENSDVKSYRSEIEKKIRSNGLLELFDPSEPADQNYIKDMVRDITIGVPDLDIVKVQIQANTGRSNGTVGVNLDNTQIQYIPMHKFTGGSYKRIDFMPSRWKSMTRPVYDQILPVKPTVNWSDRDNYDNRTKDYILSSDYLLTRYPDGESPHPYDFIDQAISTRIYSADQSSSFDPQDKPSIFWKSLINGLYNRYVDEYSIANLKIQYPNIGVIAEDIVTAEEIVQGEAPIALYVEIGATILSLIVGLLSQERQVQTTNRGSLQPLRVFKQGGVRLRSNKKRYSSKLNPCPIIFLGFNDEFRINSPLELLNKNDEYEDFYFTKNFSGISKPRMVGSPGVVRTLQSNRILPETNLLSNFNQEVLRDLDDITPITNETLQSVIFGTTDTDSQTTSPDVNTQTDIGFGEDLFEPSCKSVIRRLTNIREVSTGDIINRINGGFEPIEFNGSPLTMYRCALIADIEECCGEYFDPLNRRSTNTGEFKIVEKNVVLSYSEISGWYKECISGGNLLPYYESFYRVSDIGTGKDGLRNLNNEFAFLTTDGERRIYWGNECNIDTAFSSFEDYKNFLYRAISPDSNFEFDNSRTDKFRYRLSYSLYTPGNVYSSNSPQPKTIQMANDFAPTEDGLIEVLSSRTNIVAIMSRVCGYDPCEDLEKEVEKPEGVEVMPIMKHRPKQYGVNPLLDVYYLNMPFYSTKNPGRVPFRRGTNTSERDWPTLDIGQFPSMFPPLWNEAGRVPNTPQYPNGVKWDWDWGDIFWKDREPNVIIPAKDRWESEVIEENEDLVLLLTDKTPILDLYYSLMELHVKGVSWSVILNYVNRIKSCVNTTPYRESMDLNQLNMILDEVLDRLNIADKVEYEGYSEKIVIVSDQYWGVVDVEDVGIEKEIRITNNSNSQITIDYLAIENTDNLNLDTYLQPASRLFVFNQTKLDRNLRYDDGIITGVIPPKTTMKIPVLFRDSTSKPVEDGFLYVANLVSSISLFNGETILNTNSLAAEVAGRRIGLTKNEFGKTPLFAPTLLEFGYISSNEESRIIVPVRNMSEKDFVEIRDISIRNEKFYKIENEFIVEVDVPSDFKYFDLVLPNSVFERLRPSIIRTETTNNAFEIQCTPIFNNNFPIVESLKKYEQTSIYEDFENSLYFSCEVHISYTYGTDESTLLGSNTLISEVRGRTIFVNQ
jgi:hypothetical protein